MGLSSSQARLFSLTSRQHDKEYKAQKLEAQKLEMANESTQVYTEYEDALNAQKIQYKTVGADGTSTYIDATAANLTTYNAASTDKQRFIKTSDEKMIVSGDVKAAYDASEGISLNMFLAKLGYASTSEPVNNISTLKTTIQNSNAYNVSTYDTATYGPSTTNVNITNSERLELIANLQSIKSSLFDSKAEVDDKAKTVTGSEQVNLTTLSNGITTFLKSLNQIIGWLGDTECDIDQDFLKLVFSGAAGTFSGPGLANAASSQHVDIITPDSTGGNINLTTVLSALQNYNTTYGTTYKSTGSTDASGKTYYTNVFNEIVKSGGCVSISDANMNSSKWLQSQVDGANIFLYECNSTSGGLNAGGSGTGIYTDTFEISVATDTGLQEVSDDRELKKAEAKYESSMAKIDAKDKKFDTDIASLDTERTAIKTEIDTLKTVAKDNVDRTFKLFS